jgi:hypothetical protein
MTLTFSDAGKVTTADNDVCWRRMKIYLCVLSPSHVSLLLYGDWAKQEEDDDDAESCSSIKSRNKVQTEPSEYRSQEALVTINVPVLTPGSRPIQRQRQPK